MSVCSKETIIQYEELPEFNGIKIKSIYAQKRDDGYYRTRDLWAGETPDFYLLVPYFFALHNEPEYQYQYVKTLPESIACVFGIQEHEGSIMDVHYITYRTSGSGNGSFTDESMHLGGTLMTNKTSHSFSLYRGLNQYGVKAKSNLGKRMLGTLKTKIDAPHCKEWEYTYYPCSFIRTEGGLNYPDVALESWRWSYGRPYISNDNGKNDNIRVWHEGMKAHVYLQRADNIENGEENLVHVDHSRHHDKKPEQFCIIDEWASTKEGAANEIIRFKAKKTKDGFDFIPMVNGKEQDWKRNYFPSTIYRIMRIAYV
jgi:hypothetical protein